MGRFQILVLALLVAVVAELAVIAVKLPVVPALAQGGPAAVVVVDPLYHSASSCVVISRCARIEDGALKVSTR